MVHTYRTYGINPYLYLFGGFAFSVAALALIVYMAVGSGDAPPLWFSVLWLVAVAVMVQDVLFRLSYEIRLGDDGACEFRGLLVRRRLDVQQITSVRPARGAPNVYAVIRHQGGKIKILQPVDGFRDFLDRLEEQNPHIEVRGF